MKTVGRGQLVVGGPLPFSIFDEDNNLLLAKGLILRNDRQLAALVDRGVYFDETEENAPPKPTRPSSSGGDAGIAPVVQETPIDQISKIRRELSALLGQQPINPHNFAGRILALATRLANVCADHPEAALATTLYDREFRYSMRHMIHVAIVANVVAEGAKMDPSDHFSIICAALTMNLGMLDLQDSLNKMQGQELSPAQRQTIREHPAKSVAMLRQMGVDDQTWLDFVAQHHEVIDGSGYPRGLKGQEIALGAQILALSDQYTARLEHRADRGAVAPNHSLREIFLTGGKHVDPMLAAVLVKRVGIYPPGMIVELENGEVAVVTKRTGNANAPEVHAFLTPGRTLLDRYLKRDTTTKPYTIKGSVPLDSIKVRINPLQFWNR